MRWLLLTLFGLFTLQPTFAQIKVEREYRIKEEAVPEQAREFVKNTFEDARMKWYAEENQQRKTIEAKGAFKGIRYSVEFDTDGKLLDIEGVIRYMDIPEETRDRIEKNLSTTFSSFKVQRTQRQWKGNPAILAALVAKKESRGQYQTHYEITIRGTRDRRKDFYEILATDKGEIVRESKIVQRNNQHLIF
jgi:hypothetical protein